jgi:hypothetical protein
MYSDAAKVLTPPKIRFFSIPFDWIPDKTFNSYGLN